MKLKSLVPFAVVIGAALSTTATPAQAAACTHVDGLVPLYVCVPPKG